MSLWAARAILNHRNLQAILESWSRASGIDGEIQMPYSAWARNATGSLPPEGVEGAGLLFPAWVIKGSHWTPRTERS